MDRAPRDFVGYGEDPPKVRWPNDARVAVSLVVNFEEGAERSPLYGDDSMEPGGEGFAVPPGFRDLRAETAFSYGTRCGFWRLMDIFERHGTPASFFICGAALERNPRLGRVITDQGHEPVSHGYRWMPAYLLSREQERDDLRRNVDVIHTLTGQRPLGHYSRGESPHTRDLMQDDGGFVYNCDTYADDLPYYAMHRGAPMLMIPYSLEINDTKFNRPTGMSEPRDLYRYLVSTFDCLPSGRRDDAPDDVAGHPHAHRRPAGAGGGHRGVHPTREVQGRRLVRPADRYRTGVDGPVPPIACVGTMTMPTGQGRERRVSA